MAPIARLTGSYRAAFVNGILWNALNLAIALWLLRQPRGRAHPLMIAAGSPK